MNTAKIIADSKEDIEYFQKKIQMDQERVTILEECQKEYESVSKDKEIERLQSKIESIICMLELDCDRHSTSELALMIRGMK